LGSILRAKLLIQLASLRWNIFQDVAQADPPTMAALELFQAAGDTTGSAQAQVMHGFYLSASGRDPVEAIQCFESGLALYQNLDDWRGIAAVLHLLGDAVGLQGDLVRALALLEQSVALLRQLDASEGELALTLTGLGDVVRQHGDTVRAQALYQEAIELCCTIGDTHAGIWPLRGLIEIAVTHRGHEQVLTMVEDHVDQIRAQQDQYNLLFVLHLLGALVSAQGQTARGATLLLEALHKQKQMGKGSILDEGLQECARIAARQGQWLWATRMLGAIMEPDPVLKATVRDALPGAAFDAAWVAGQALTWEQAADEACIWLEHIANGT
jgi:tetratricopeptide (TPR) repeat protein